MPDFVITLGDVMKVAGLLIAVVAIVVALLISAALNYAVKREERRQREGRPRAKTRNVYRRALDWAARKELRRAERLDREEGR